MTRKTYTLMVVHAHPDDEASSTGGLLRFAAEQGHTTIVVTCTRGDLGEVKMPGVRLNPRQDPADRQRLALIRQAELAHAAALLRGLCSNGTKTWDVSLEAIETMGCRVAWPHRCRDIAAEAALAYIRIG